MDGGLEQANTTDFVCVNRIIADPWRQCFAVSPVDIGESEDLLTEEELDLVQGYMDQPFHDWGSQREGKGQDKAWWEVDSIVSRSYDGNTFVKRVLDIEDMLQKQHRRRILTVIDLKHGYHQMPLAEESRACTALSTPLGPL